MGARTPVNRSTATKITRGAQGAAVVLALGAGAIIALDMPVGDANEPGDATTIPTDFPMPEINTVPLIPSITTVDFEGIVARMSQLDNAPEPPDKPEDTTVIVDPPEPGAGDPTIADRVAYLGHIQVGDSLMALVRVDGVQRTAMPGRAISGTGANGQTPLELIRVRDDHIRVRAATPDAGPPTRIERADGGGSSPSDVAIAAPARPGSSIAKAQAAADRLAKARERIDARATGSVLEPDPLKRRLDTIERLYDQGRIDDERYKTMVERAKEQLDRAEARRNQGDE